jgi:hypothetical protein
LDGGEINVLWGVYVYILEPAASIAFREVATRNGTHVYEKPCGNALQHPETQWNARLRLHLRASTDESAVHLGSKREVLALRCKLVLKQKTEGAAIKKQKGQFLGAVGIYRGIGR